MRTLIFLSFCSFYQQFYSLRHVPLMPSKHFQWSEMLSITVVSVFHFYFRLGRCDKYLCLNDARFGAPAEFGWWFQRAVDSTFNWEREWNESNLLYVWMIVSKKQHRLTIYYMFLTLTYFSVLQNQRRCLRVNLQKHLHLKRTNWKWRKIFSSAILHVWHSNPWHKDRQTLHSWPYRL